MIFVRVGVISVISLVTALTFGNSQVDALTALSRAEQARVLADAVASNIHGVRAAELHDQLDRLLRSATTMDQLKTYLDNLQKSGIRDFVFRAASEGTRGTLDGSQQELWKGWYKVESESPDDKRFLVIEIVFDGEGASCSGFSVMSFLGDPPPHLSGD